MTFGIKYFGYLYRLLLLFITLLSIPVFAQFTAEDYKQADSISKFNDMVYNTILGSGWIDTTHVLWYALKTKQGTEYFLADSKEKNIRKAFDHEMLSDAIKKVNGSNRVSPYTLPIRDLSFKAGLDTITFTINNINYEVDLSSYELKETSRVRQRGNRGHWGQTTDELSQSPVMSPDSLWTAFIKDYNVYIRNRQDNTEYQLSFDGAQGDTYSSFISWSPDSRYLATNKVRLHEKQFIRFIESAPSDQLQPKLHEIEYLKPGDALPIKRPSLFNVEEKLQIPLETKPFEHQYSLSNPAWWDDSRGFTFEFNERGHQTYQVVEVDAQTGNVRILIDETSPTFIDYSGKRYRHNMKNGEEIIWASERDGWNHLYLYDAKRGRVKNQITKGEWVVRGVEHVDEENRQILFRASGRNKSEDPYNIHYYRIGFNGRGLTELTPEEMNHHASFSHNHKFFLNTFSTPEYPPISVIRDGENGNIVLKLAQADISDLENEGWIAPEVFVAKGRDGKTDIWGNIYRPSNFDPEKDYPIIEYIYAGPHSSFVQKSFAPYMGAFSSLAELGFIVVQIDGMGTSNRSKTFHDVCWKNLKDAGFPDRILWIKAAAVEYPYMDTTRVGIYGASAGGQSAMGALLFHPEFYIAGVASSGCHDNRMDKIWWNEQWMGYPIGPHYQESSNVVNAHKLQGNLMLINGEIDDNVDPASTMQVAKALIEANKEFELVILPSVGHTLGGVYGERKRRDFFIRHLLKQKTPNWNSQ
ncbi:S9 family peptidase [Alkalitalea saponilacus]|uniref:Dipeptidyl aminopeptidase/acylaminoacyl peptidase n=1 Tax=Alkalitalea saponilacus TaxID=889453 RepID=A0A1T5AFT2_9BACT|nr:S9 family peptidase [Alkalitalea saponilacus]ASB48718.1 S9 family peptidase [Alkalitalea saponilacus]SKB33834.1 Dipeptidyl aminopeptidase/acylaminoacyl peptidase [Alkalitalea saponilacus]